MEAALSGLLGAKRKEQNIFVNEGVKNASLKKQQLTSGTRRDPLGKGTIMGKRQRAQTVSGMFGKLNNL